MQTTQIDKARDILTNARRVMVLTGAGISAESGVPTFRGGGGALTWRGMPFTTLSSAQMVKDDLPLVWEWFDYRRSVLAECKPNAGHLALSVAENTDRFERLVIVTQNIDGLHAQAESKNVIELHGSIHQARCESCNHIRLIDQPGPDERPPVCHTCGSRMRPNVILFGEMLDSETVSKAFAAAQDCDLCVVVGTSALVSPANTLPTLAKRNGASLIEINPEETHLTPLADICLREFSSTALPLLFSQ